MRLLWKIVLGIFGFFFPLVTALLIVLLADVSWWVLVITAIIDILIFLLIGAVWTIVYFWKRRPQAQAPFTTKLAIAQAVNDKKYDEDDPDNFLILKKRYLRVGDAGTERTLLIHLSGIGTEMNRRLDAIVNPTSVDQGHMEISWLTNATPEEVKETARLMALHPAEEVKEERVIGSDPYGRPITRITTKKVTAAEKQAQEQKQETEEANRL